VLPDQNPALPQAPRLKQATSTEVSRFFEFCARQPASGAAAVEEGTVSREDRLLGNVIDALRLVLDERPDGCLEAALWHGVEACFVAREVFDEAVEIMVNVGWASRVGGRLLTRRAQHASRNSLQRRKIFER
jgi:hypothetical protein